MMSSLRTLSKVAPIFFTAKQCFASILPKYNMMAEIAEQNLHKIPTP